MLNGNTMAEDPVLNSTALKLIIICVVSYLIGSVSFSVIIGRIFFKKDVRDNGSGNAGATNMARVFGLVPGAAVLVLDTLKTAAALIIGSRICGEWGLCAGGICCLTGHCFPVFHGFKGGKGVSASLAVIFAVSWKVGICVCFTFAVCAVLSKKVSLASLMAATAALCAAVLGNLSLPKTVLLLFAAVLVFVRHIENIKRLLNGTEKDFKAK